MARPNAWRVRWLKMALGALLITAGVLTLSGIDRAIQTVLERALPYWVVALTTRIWISS